MKSSRHATKKKSFTSTCKCKEEENSENKQESRNLLVDTVNEQDHQTVHLKTVLGVFQNVEKKLDLAEIFTVLQLAKLKLHANIITEV